MNKRFPFSLEMPLVPLECLEDVSRVSVCDFLKVKLLVNFGLIPNGTGSNADLG